MLGVMKTIIVWFRNDLRLHDNPALHAAIQDADMVVPVFVLDDTLLSGKHGSPNRNRFLLESLVDLRQSMQKAGGNLIIRSGKPSEVLLELARQTDATTVHAGIDYTPYARTRDGDVATELRAHNIAFEAFPGRLIVDSIKDIVTGAGNPYSVFTPFYKNWSQIDRRQVISAPENIRIPEGLEEGDVPSIDELARNEQLSPDAIKGGETAGRKRLEQFMDNGISHYAEMHDSLTPDGTSRLSPYLHFGCVSPLEIESMLPPGDSPARFGRQLAWRDFYNYILFHNPSNAKQSFQARYHDLQWTGTETMLRAWQEGNTGYPVVDAAMRQLQREGWMHNRARLIVGSFLTKDLGLNWQDGERHFMRMLIDGDQSSNNGNWQWIASVGVDPAPLFRRLYNPTTQQKRYDPDGAYVRFYVPELKHVPDAFIAEPSKMSDEEQARANCIIGKDYPAPIVDHAAARLQALDRYREASVAV